VTDHLTEVEALAMTAAENGQRRMRVLVEAPAQPWHFTVKEAQELEHCDVTFCGGPAEGHGPCPITVGRACPFGSDFDVVVAGLGLDTSDGRDILTNLKLAYPNAHVVVQAWPADLERHPELLDGCQVIVFPWTTQKLCAAVHSAIATA
jgi:hypothetical protein